MKTEGIYLSWILVKDVEKAIEFYTQVVGLKLKEFHKDFRWAELSGPGGSLLGIGEENAECPMKAGINAIVTITVDNIDDARAHFIEKGATIIGDIIEIPEHVKMQSFSDADGNTMQLVQMLTSPHAA